MEPGDPALEVYLLPVTLAVCPALGGDVTRAAASGAAGVTVLVRVGLTGADAATTGAGAGFGCWVNDVRRAGTGAGAAGVTGVVVTVVVVAGVGGEVVVVAEAEAVAASLALFSCLILSISSSSLGGALVGGGCGLGAAGFGAGGGVSFFLGRISSISCSLSL